MLIEIFSGDMPADDLLYIMYSNQPSVLKGINLTSSGETRWLIEFPDTLIDECSGCISSYELVDGTKIHRIDWNASV